jgi:GTP-binding protein
MDKVNKNQRPKNLKMLMEALQIEDREDVILFSSETKAGKEEVEDLIEEILKALNEERQDN